MMSTVSSPSPGKPLAWWRRSAPPLIGWPLAACYGLLLTPAILSAALQWSWAITVALLIPGVVMQICLGYMAGRAYGIHYRPQMLPMRQRLALSGLAGLLGGLSPNIRPTYIAPLCFVIVMVFIVDPAWRIMWKRAQTT